MLDIFFFQIQFVVECFAIKLNSMCCTLDEKDTPQDHRADFPPSDNPR